MTNKRIVLSIILIVFYFFGIQVAHSQTSNKELKLGLVLSGGGAKGFAHIGVLRVLEEENIPITLISGTSMGNIIGALYSVGYSPDEIEEFAKYQDWSMLLTDDIDRKLKSRFKQDFEEKHPLELRINKDHKKLLLPAGLVRGNNILNIFCGMTAEYPDSINFADLPIPFACVAYDLNSKSEVVIDHGHLAKAMLTSMAIPGIFAPVHYKDMEFVDGGVINNFPVDVALDMGADLVVGVDLRQENEEDDVSLESITTILRGIVSKLESEKHDANIEMADVVINPDLRGITALDFETDLIEKIIKSGEDAAREQMPKIKELLADKNIKRNNIRNKKPTQQWLITDIELPKEYNKEHTILLQHLHLHHNHSYSMMEIDQAVKRVYGYGNFESVYYKLNKNDNGYTLKLFIDNKKEASLKIGGALNTVDITSIYANYSYQDYSRALNLLTLDAKVARNPQVLFLAETNRLLSTTGFKARGRFNRMDYHTQTKESGRMRAGSISTSLYTYRRFKEVADLNIGIDETYFYSNDYYRNIADAKDSRIRDLYTSAYGFLTVDSRNRSFIPDNGVLMRTGVSLVTMTNDFRHFTPTVDFMVNSIHPIADNVAIKADLYHRSVFDDDDVSIYYANYSSNRYNAYSDFYFPLLGQGGITVLDNVSTLGDLGLRIEVAPKHYIIPRVQLLWQVDKWNDLNFDKRDWGAGFTYQHRSKLSRLDFTIGYTELHNHVNFHGGVGYQF